MRVRFAMVGVEGWVNWCGGTWWLCKEGFQFEVIFQFREDGIGVVGPWCV